MLFRDIPADDWPRISHHVIMKIVQPTDTSVQAHGISKTCPRARATLHTILSAIPPLNWSTQLLSLQLVSVTTTVLQLCRLSTCHDGRYQAWNLCERAHRCSQDSGCWLAAWQLDRSVWLRHQSPLFDLFARRTRPCVPFAAVNHGQPVENASNDGSARRLSAATCLLCAPFRFRPLPCFRFPLRFHRRTDHCSPFDGCRINYWPVSNGCATFRCSPASPSKGQFRSRTLPI